MRDWSIEVLPVGPLQMNAVLLTAPAADGGPGDAVLIDPGDEADRACWPASKPPAAA